MDERTSLEKESEKNIENKDEIKRTPAQIREQIEETRSEMSETIDELQERLSVSNISEQVSEEVSERATALYESAKHTVYDATLGKAQEFLQTAAKEIEKLEILERIKESKIIDKAAANPLPLFLASVGVGFLISRSSGGKKQISKHSKYRRYNEWSNSQMEDNSRMENIKETIGDTASSAYDKANDTANSAYNKAGSAISESYETAGNAAKSAYQTAGNAADATMETAGNLTETVREQYDYYIEENPLLVGAVALAAGVVIGLLIPTTSYENKLVGETRDNLLEQAKDKAKDTISKVKDVAGQAVNVATEEVKDQVSGDQTKEKSA